MASNTTRLFMRNLASVAGVTLEVAPAEDPSGPATSLLSPDRYATWMAPSGVSHTVMLDLASSKAVDYVGLLNMRRGELAQPNSVVIQAAATYPNPTVSAASTSSGVNTVTKAAFNFAGAGFKVGQTLLSQSPGGVFATNVTVTNVATGTLTLSGQAGSTNTGTFSLTMTDNVSVGSFFCGKDVLYPITRLTKRYWSFEFGFATQAFSLGNMFLGVMSPGQGEDLGIVWSPGSGRVTEPGENTILTAGGNTRRERIGEDRTRFDLSFQAIPESIMDKLMTLTAARTDLYGQPVLLTGWDEAYQVARPTMDWRHRWGTPDLYDVSMQLEALP